MLLKVCSLSNAVLVQNCLGSPYQLANVNASVFMVNSAAVNLLRTASALLSIRSSHLLVTSEASPVAGSFALGSYAQSDEH